MKKQKQKIKKAMAKKNKKIKLIEEMKNKIVTATATKDDKKETANKPSDVQSRVLHALLTSAKTATLRGHKSMTVCISKYDKTTFIRSIIEASRMAKLPLSATPTSPPLQPVATTQRHAVATLKASSQLHTSSSKRHKSSTKHRKPSSKQRKPSERHTSSTKLHRSSNMNRKESAKRRKPSSKRGRHSSKEASKKVASADAGQGGVSVLLIQPTVILAPNTAANFNRKPQKDGKRQKKLQHGPSVKVEHRHVVNKMTAKRPAIHLAEAEAVTPRIIVMAATKPLKPLVGLSVKTPHAFQSRKFATQTSKKGPSTKLVKKVTSVSKKIATMKADATRKQPQKHTNNVGPEKVFKKIGGTSVAIMKHGKNVHHHHQQQQHQQRQPVQNANPAKGIGCTNTCSNKKVGGTKSTTVVAKQAGKEPPMPKPKQVAAKFKGSKKNSVSLRGRQSTKASVQRPQNKPRRMQKKQNQIEKKLATKKYRWQKSTVERNPASTGLVAVKTSQNKLKQEKSNENSAKAKVSKENKSKLTKSTQKSVKNKMTKKLPEQKTVKVDNIKSVVKPPSHKPPQRKSVQNRPASKIKAATGTVIVINVPKQSSPSAKQIKKAAKINPAKTEAGSKMPMKKSDIVIVVQSPQNPPQPPKEIQKTRSHKVTKSNNVNRPSTEKRSNVAGTSKLPDKPTVGKEADGMKDASAGKAKAVQRKQLEMKTPLDTNKPMKSVARDRPRRSVKTSKREDTGVELEVEFGRLIRDFRNVSTTVGVDRFVARKRRDARSSRDRDGASKKRAVQTRRSGIEKVHNRKKNKVGRKHETKSGRLQHVKMQKKVHGDVVEFDLRINVPQLQPTVKDEFADKVKKNGAEKTILLKKILNRTKNTSKKITLAKPDVRNEKHIIVTTPKKNRQSKMIPLENNSDKSKDSPNKSASSKLNTKKRKVTEKQKNNAQTMKTPIEMISNKLKNIPKTIRPSKLSDKNHVHSKKLNKVDRLNVTPLSIYSDKSNHLPMEIMPYKLDMLKLHTNEKEANLQPTSLHKQQPPHRQLNVERNVQNGDIIKAMKETFQTPKTKSKTVSQSITNNYPTTRQTGKSERINKGADSTPVRHLVESLKRQQQLQMQLQQWQAQIQLQAEQQTLQQQQQQQQQQQLQQQLLLQQQLEQLQKQQQLEQLQKQQQQKQQQKKQHQLQQQRNQQQDSDDVVCFDINMGRSNGHKFTIGIRRSVLTSASFHRKPETASQSEQVGSIPLEGGESVVRQGLFPAAALVGAFPSAGESTGIPVPFPAVVSTQLGAIPVAAVSPPTDDACSSSPCLRGGTCQTAPLRRLGYHCRCPAGYAGARCDLAATLCQASSPCLNGGVCARVIDRTHCVCRLPFDGALCQRRTSTTCSSGTPCVNGGRCVDDPLGGFRCRCPVDWHGERCRRQVRFEVFSLTEK